jgi:hypothetical protein
MTGHHGVGRFGDQSSASGAAADAVRRAERDRLRALVDANLDVALPLHADDFHLVTPGGETLTKSQYLGAIASGEITYHVFEPISEIDVRAYGQSAVIRYRSRIEISVGPTHFSDECWHTDLYEQRDGRWQIVWSQATKIQ